MHQPELPELRERTTIIYPKALSGKMLGGNFLENYINL